MGRTPGSGQRSPRGKFIFTPQAVIHHRVPATRQRFAYYRTRCYAEGLSKALVTDSVGVGDGLADERALPLLREFGFPATVFVTTGWLQDAGSWAAGHPLDRTMAWSQVKELHDSGIEVAAHSHSHAQLDQLEDRPLHDELSLGKKLLEERLTVRHSTAPGTFARIAACEDLRRVFALDRTLTNGYPLVRRTRRALRKATP